MPESEVSPKSRQLLAALANDDTRVVAARLMLGADLSSASEGFSPSRRRKIVESLTRSGMLDVDGAFRASVFREVLAAAPVRKREGVEKFVDGKRIRQYPVGSAERIELLRWIVPQVLAPGEVLPERELNARLEAFSEDTAVLRRYLVDYELLERRADGSEYALVER